jgi:APA family basic amino acid/polyamine antiporter
VFAGLARPRGTADAVVLGLAAMLGAGVFGAWGPAAAAAGAWLPLAVVVAGVAALCAAASGADVARAGGGVDAGPVVRDRARSLSAGTGRLSAAAYLLGRAAVAATAAGVFGMHVLPSRPVATAVAVIVVATGLAAAGVACTARAAWALVGGIGVVLLVVVLVGLSAVGEARPAASAAAQVLVPAGPGSEGAPGVLTAAGLLFFAYAGFARLFPLGPQRAAGRRRVVALTVGIALAVHLAVAVALLLGLGAEPLAAEPVPLVTLVDTGGAPALGVLVRVGAAVACGSVLLNALAGWGATAAEMAGRGELPRPMGRVGARGRPWRADVAGGLMAAVVVVLAGPVGALALAACALLVHYALVGLAAVLLPAECRSWPVGVPVAAAFLCLLLALLLPLRPLAVTAVLLAALWTLATLGARRAAGL